MKALVLGLSLLASAAHAQELFPIQQVPSGGTCGSGLAVLVDNPTPTAGSTVNVTLCNGPGNAGDTMTLTIYPNKQYVGTDTHTNGATNGTFPMTIPVTVQDRPAEYAVAFNPNGAAVTTAFSPVLVVPPTITPPAPTATLPTALAADPFTPAHTFTVCMSGCDYTNPADAVTGAAGLDNVLIKISSGEYTTPLPTFSIPHLWLKGIGPTMPHLFGTTGTSASIIGTSQGACGSSFTMDNLELGPWNYWTIKSTDCITFTMRNSYIHDTPQGMITGNTQHITLNLYNDVFARHGSGDGPQHDIYVGEGDLTNIVNVKNSVFEQSFIGHAFKERAATMNVDCSMLIVNQDAVYLGSETLDAAYAGAVTLTNVLSASGGANVSWSVSKAWDSMRYGYEAGPPPFSYPNTSTITSSGSTFLDDDPTTNHDFVTIAVPITPTAPITWSNNKFVWSTPAAYVPTDGGAVFFNTPNCCGSSSRWAHAGDIVISSSPNQIFTSRSSAGLPEVGNYPKGWRDLLPLMPAACTDPIGNVAVPAS